MATAIIKSTISANMIVGSRDDAAVGTIVSLEHNGTATTYYWEFLNVPPGSVVSFSNSTSSAPTFTPDVVGSYLIKLTIDGDNLGADTRVVAVKTSVLGMRIPAGGETNEYNNNPSGLDGWFEALHNAFVAIDTAAGTIPTDISDLNTFNLSQLNAQLTGATLDSITGTRTPTTHSLGSGFHTAITLAQLNTLVSDADLDATTATRTPAVHSLGSSFHTAITLAQLNTLISDADVDATTATRTPTVHSLGSSFHTAITLSQLNTLVSDADLDATTAPRDPFSHGLAGDKHLGSSLGDLNAKITDATLVDQYDIGFGLVYSNGNSLYLDNGPIILSGPTAATVLSDGYVGLQQSSDPSLSVYYGAIYTKVISGVTELFYKDDNGNVVQLTNNGSLGPELEYYAQKVLLDAYATNLSLSDYAEKTLLDAYATNVVLSNYATKVLLDDYATITSLDAQRTLLDGYTPLSEFVGFVEQVIDPAYYDDYGTIYSKDIDGYTELHYIDNYGNMTQITNRGLDVVLTSPNNTKWILSVDDYGNLYTTSI